MVELASLGSRTIADLENALTESRAEAGAQHVSLLQRYPLTRPPMRSPSAGWQLLPRTPPLCQIVTTWRELEEIALVQLRLGGPHVVLFDTQCPDDADFHAGLLSHLANHRRRRPLTWLDAPCRDLDAGDFEREFVVRERQQPIVADNVADGLLHPPAHWTAPHAI